MRPIEFRAWDETEKRWLNIDEFFIFYDGTIFLVTWLDDSVYDDAVTLDRAGEDIKLEQYTGLKDKKGNRIFDGDIVRIDSLEVFNLTSNYNDTPVRGSCISEVKIIEGHTYVWLTPIIDGKKIRYGARLLLKGLSKYISRNVATGSVEVIGNIHDNPELLGGAAE
ncbi:hypothetical protein HCB26_06250 [Listeria booriae]|uniref:YopX protein domain-containing protein n=1 Tax=Listeria booriae TaxID=1552123 RepID=A0A7X0YYY1_9LIST|nr:YopX family protein [Listeria booriae]MBC1316629.1 hypothetical protein [Listeria booriae]MBC2166167.1 hypothetical protein [Listeria booriae]